MTSKNMKPFMNCLTVRLHREKMRKWIFFMVVFQNWVLKHSDCVASSLFHIRFLYYHIYMWTGNILTISNWEFLTYTIFIIIFITASCILINPNAVKMYILWICLYIYEIFMKKRYLFCSYWHFCTDASIFKKKSSAVFQLKQCRCVTS